MLLAHEILDAITKEKIVIKPLQTKDIGPNSVDLHLSPKIVEYESLIIDSKKDNKTVEFTIPEAGFVLRPGRIYLASTIEYTETHVYIPQINGVSSNGRLGLNIHATAGFGDIGFCGNWTLELFVIQPVRIYAGMRIAQLCFFECDSKKVIKKYSGKYQNQTDVVKSLSYKDYKEL